MLTILICSWFRALFLRLFHLIPLQNSVIFIPVDESSWNLLKLNTNSIVLYLPVSFSFLLFCLTLFSPPLSSNASNIWALNATNLSFRTNLFSARKRLLHFIVWIGQIHAIVCISPNAMHIAQWFTLYAVGTLGAIQLHCIQITLFPSMVFLVQSNVQASNFQMAEISSWITCAWHFRTKHPFFHCMLYSVSKKLEIFCREMREMPPCCKGRKRICYWGSFVFQKCGNSLVFLGRYIKSKTF